MKHLKRYFSRENGFSLKECFNMVMTVMTCFFTEMMGKNGKVMQGVKGLVDRQNVSMREWMAVMIGWRLSTYEVAGGHGKHMPGRFFQKNMQDRMHVRTNGQAVVEWEGMRGRRGNRIRDVSCEKGLPCMGRSVCRGSP